MTTTKRQLTPREHVLFPLSNDERQELQDAMDYLEEKTASSDTAPSIAEGSLGAMIAKLSPNVRYTLKALSDTMETPRGKPYQDKLSERDYADIFEMDPDVALRVKSALDSEHVAAGVQRRMGTDADRPLEPPSLRDLVAAAVDRHQ